MKFCSECGADVEGKKFCSKCGRKTLDAIAAEGAVVKKTHLYDDVLIFILAFIIVPPAGLVFLFISKKRSLPTKILMSLFFPFYFFVFYWPFWSGFFGF